MDAAFLLDEPSRANFLRLLMQSFGCTYICLWSYMPQPSNFLVFHDGCYKEEGYRPSSSAGSLARQLFDQYRQLIFPLENDSRVPGYAFRNNQPYCELRELQLQTRAFHEIQRQFYREARIKSAAFMGCRSGEIELGLSDESTLINLEMGLRDFFPEDLSRQSPLGEILQQPAADPNKPSSSSSSLKSLSTSGSPDSSLIFNIPTTTHIASTTESIFPLQPISTTVTDPHQQAMQALSQIRGIQLPSIETENATFTRAILAVLTSPPSSSSSTSIQQQPNFPYYNYQQNPNASAFKPFRSPLPPLTPMRANLRRQSSLKRAILYYRNLHIIRRREHMLGSRPTNTQLHHMMSERKRREKLNESFQALRSLLPPGTKRDKASVLTSTREHLSSLKAQVAELSKQNQLLKAQLLPSKEAAEEVLSGSSSSSERVDVRITSISESTAEERLIDLGVSLRGECTIEDIAIRLLEFLKQDRNVSLMYMQANIHMAEQAPVNHVNFRLRVEGDGWDEPAFMEAVKRLLADLAQ